MTWQPEPVGPRPAEPDRSDGQAHEPDRQVMPSYGHELGSLPPRRRGWGRVALFSLLLAAGLGGLAVSAFGIAHQLLPRQFTVAQQRQIMTWQMTRRWRAVPASVIFPSTVRYDLPGYALDSDQGLLLQAHRLGIAVTTSCTSGVTAKAARVLTADGCSAVLRATYVDSSGSLVATVAIAVLPDRSAARNAAGQLTGLAGRNPALVRSLPVARTPASDFRDRQRQLSRASYGGPYVIMSTVGFADGRRKVRVSADQYLELEMLSLTRGLAGSAQAVLGSPPSTPVCPGAPGC